MSQESNLSAENFTKQKKTIGITLFTVSRNRIFKVMLPVTNSARSGTSEGKSN